MLVTCLNYDIFNKFRVNVVTNQCAYGFPTLYQFS